MKIKAAHKEAFKSVANITKNCVVGRNKDIEFGRLSKN